MGKYVSGRCMVVEDYLTDVKEIVTAVCYCPDGKGVLWDTWMAIGRYDVVGNRCRWACGMLKRKEEA
ncbi:hypothetical protein HAX54_048702 [Datura stramonium]|uniref:Uncharacterized protein n=1 Tax=Datura stramonium TaxID=4076 RepID=A0ABS8SUK6_DATST|nr:hypothetical protein [Datura stramonium]